MCKLEGSSGEIAHVFFQDLAVFSYLSNRREEQCLTQKVGYGNRFPSLPLKPLPHILKPHTHTLPHISRLTFLQVSFIYALKNVHGGKM